jgi:hypothetical protein
MSHPARERLIQSKPAKLAAAIRKQSSIAAARRKADCEIG